MVMDPSKILPVQELERNRHQLGLVDGFLRLLREEASTEQLMASFQTLEEAYQKGQLAPTVWQRLLFITLSVLDDGSPDGHRELAEAVRENCVALLSKDELRTSTLQKLLDALFSSYTESVEGIKELLVEQVNHEVRLDRAGRRHEIVNLLSHQRRVFELPYPGRQTDLVIGTINRLRGYTDTASARIQRELARRWLIDGQEPDRPPVARRAIRDHLRREEFQALDDIYVRTIYRTLSTGNRDELEQVLEVLASWFGDLDVHDEEAFVRLRKVYSDFSRSDEYALDPNSLEFKILVANGQVLEALLEQLGKWVPHPTIPVRILQLCCHLPLTRNSVARLVEAAEQNPDWRYLLPEIIELLRAVISGMGRTIPGLGSMEEDASYQDVLRLRERVHQQGVDLLATQFLYRVLSDHLYPDDIRLQTLRALIHIYPEDLGVRLGAYVDDHPPDDAAMQVVLTAIVEKKLNPSWPALHRGIAIWATAQPDFALDLMETAACLGDPGMVAALVPLALDHENEDIRQGAEAALQTAGYDLSIRLERLRRKLVELDILWNEARQERHKRFIRSAELEFEFSESRRQLTGNRVKSGQLQQALDLTSINYHVDSADYRIRLGEIDQQVQALLKKIKSLAERKHAVQLELSDVKQGRDALQSNLDVLNDQISCEQSRQEWLEMEIRNCTQKARELEAELEWTTAQYRQECAHLAQVKAEEEAKQSHYQSQTRRLHERYNEREAQRATCQDKSYSLERQRECEAESLRQRMQHESSLRFSLNNLEPGADADNLERRHREALASIRQVEQRIRQCESRISSLNNQIRDISDEMASIQAEHRQLERDLSTSQARVSEAISRAGQMEAKLWNLNRQLDNIKAEIATLKAQLAESQAKIEKMLSEANRLSSRITELEIKAEQLDQQLIPVIVDLKTAQRELDQWRVDKERLEREVASFQNRFQGEYQQHDQDLRGTLEAVQTLKANIDSCNTRLSQVYQDIHKLDERINQLNNDILGLRDEYAHVSALDAEQAKMTAEAHVQESVKTRLEHDQRQQTRMAYYYQLGRACNTFAARQPDWLKTVPVTSAAGGEREAVADIEKETSNEQPHHGDGDQP